MKKHKGIHIYACLRWQLWRDRRGEAGSSCSRRWEGGSSRPLPTWSLGTWKTHCGAIHGWMTQAYPYFQLWLNVLHPKKIMSSKWEGTHQIWRKTEKKNNLLISFCQHACRWNVFWLFVSQDTMIWTQLLSEILTAEPSSPRVRPLQGSEDTSSGLANELKEVSLEHTTLEESTHRERPALTRCQSCWCIGLFYLTFTSLVAFCYSTGSGEHTGHRWNTDHRLQAFQVLCVPLGKHFLREGLTYLCECLFVTEHSK